MISKLDLIKWDFFLIKEKKLLEYGIKNKLVFPYELDVIEKLENVFWNKIPAALVLMCFEICNGRCFDMALLITHGFKEDNFRVIDATVDYIKLNPKIIAKNKKIPKEIYAKHRFVERIKNDGTIFVYDTSLGLVCEKSLYYKINNPKILRVIEKEEVINDKNWQEMENNTDEKLNFFISDILPKFAYLTLNKNQGLYEKSGLFREELNCFKQKVFSKKRN